MNRISAVLTLLALGLGSMTLTGCLVAGYSSRGGGFIFPGGLGLLVIVLLGFWLLRRR